MTITLNTGIYSIAKIVKEAREAAEKYTDINSACPYPFGSISAHVFRQEFERALEAKKCQT